jgi:AAA domain (dynein-related subfamily)
MMIGRSCCRRVVIVVPHPNCGRCHGSSASATRRWTPSTTTTKDAPSLAAPVRRPVLLLLRRPGAQQGCGGRRRSDDSKVPGAVAAVPFSTKTFVRIGAVERELPGASAAAAPLHSSERQQQQLQRIKIPTGYYLHYFAPPPGSDSSTDSSSDSPQQQEHLHHLQWMMQKDALRQDVLLVGRSDTAVDRRRLALAYAELVRQPVEYLVLSRDTTESDLKQRRRLIGTTATAASTTAAAAANANIAFDDQAPVRAAKLGHLLILDGLHRAERNVLPTLNNLL